MGNEAPGGDDEDDRVNEVHDYNDTTGHIPKVSSSKPRAIMLGLHRVEDSDKKGGLALAQEFRLRENLVRNKKFFIDA